MTITRLPMPPRMKKHWQEKQRSAIEARILPRLLKPETRELCHFQRNGGFSLTIYPVEGQDRFALRRVLAELESAGVVANSILFHNELQTQLQFGWRDALHQE